LKNKTRLAKLKTGYTKVPQKAFKLGLSSYAFHVLCVMIDVAENFYPSQQFLETMTGLSRPTLSRAIKQLVKSNCIRLIKSAKGKKAAQYEFVSPQQWQHSGRTDTQSVLRNKIMQRGKLASRKELAAKRLGCPDGQLIDHIVPIVHKDVCGLNVPWNIQYLTFEEKVKKGDSFDGTYGNVSWKNKKKV
jgi:hypothetical protein